MARTASPNLSVTISATNQTGPAAQAAAAEIQKIAAAQESANARAGASSAALAANTDRDWTKISQTIRRGSETLSKTGAVMNTVGHALGGVGGQAAQASGQIGGLLSSLGSGGALGAGLAALTGVIAAGTQAWKAYHLEEEMAADVAARHGAQIQGMSQTIIAEANAAVASLTSKTRELREAMEPGITRAERVIELRNLEIAQLTETDKLVRQLNDAKINSLSRTLAAEGESLNLQGLKKLQDREEAALTKAKTDAEHKYAAALGESTRAYLDSIKAKNEARDNFASAYRSALEGEIAQNEDVANQALAFERDKDAAIYARQMRRIEFEAGLRDARTEAERKAAEDILQIQAASANAIISVGGALANAMMSQRRDMSAAERADAQAQMGVRMAVATAQGIVSAMSLPYPGNIVAATSTAATVAAMFAELASFKEGGIVGEVQRSMGDRDAIPIIAHRGEAVLTKEQTDSIRKTLGVTGGSSMATGGMVGSAGGPGGAMNIKIENKMWVPDRVAMMRMTRTQLGVIKKLKRRGMG